MPKIILDIPEENIPLLLELTDALGLEKERVAVSEDLPETHQQLLNERLQEYKLGNTSLTAWDDFEQELNSKNSDEV